MTGQKTILLTGGTGFLGSNLLKKILLEGHDVLLLKRKTSDLSRISKEISGTVCFDIESTDLKGIFSKHKIDIILHCATNYGRRQIDPLEVLEANLQLPLKLLLLGIRSKVPCFINTDTILDKRISHYSLSKSQFKEWLKTYSKEMRCINAALEHFYGPYDDASKFTAFIIKEMLASSPSIKLTKGEQKRGFIYIDDVVDAFIKIINADIASNGYYEFEIGAGKMTTIKEFVEKVKAISKNSSTALDFGALPYRENETMSYNTDLTRIRALGWEPKISLEEGLIRTIEAERRNKR